MASRELRVRPGGRVCDRVQRRRRGQLYLLTPAEHLESLRSAAVQSTAATTPARGQTNGGLERAPSATLQPMGWHRAVRPPSCNEEGATRLRRAAPSPPSGNPLCAMRAPWAYIRRPDDDRGSQNRGQVFVRQPHSLPGEGKGKGRKGECFNCGATGRFSRECPCRCKGKGEGKGLQG